MKFTALFSIAAFSAALLASSAMAADAPATAPVVAVVNIQQVMRDATAAKSVREQLESKQKSYQSELSKKDESLRKEEEELKKQRSVLSKEAFEKKAAEFRKKATDVQKEVQSKKASLDGAFDRSLAEIQKAVSEIIAGMAKEKGFQVAVPSAQTLYFDSKLDISGDVLNELNKKLTKVDVKFEESK